MTERQLLHRIGLGVRATGGILFAGYAWGHDHPQPLYYGQHIVIHAHRGTYPLWFIAGWLAGSTVWHFLKKL